MSFETERIFRNIQKFLDQHSGQFDDPGEAMVHAISLHNAGLLTFDDEDDTSRALDLFEAAMHTADKDQRSALLEEAHDLDSDNLDIYCAWALDQFHGPEVVSMIRDKADAYFKAHRQEIKESGFSPVANRPYFRAQNILLEFYKEFLFMEEAEKIAKHILRYNPNDNLGVRYQLMAIYVDSFQHKKVKAFFKKHSDYRSDDRMLLYLATSLILERDFNLAKQRIKELYRLNPAIVDFFTADEFDEYMVYVFLSEEAYRPYSKQTLALALRDMLSLFFTSSLLYYHFREILKELVPDHFAEIEERKQKNRYASLNAAKLAGTGIFTNIASQYVRPLLFEGLESLEDFKEKTEWEVLAIDGIGQATLNKLKANGVIFKEG